VVFDALAWTTISTASTNGPPDLGASAATLHSPACTQTQAEDSQIDELRSEPDLLSARGAMPVPVYTVDDGVTQPGKTHVPLTGKPKTNLVQSKPNVSTLVVSNTVLDDPDVEIVSHVPAASASTAGQLDDDVEIFADMRVPRSGSVYSGDKRVKIQDNNPQHPSTNEMQQQAHSRQPTLGERLDQLLSLLLTLLTRIARLCRLVFACRCI
jgi:hypothetical protein